MSKRAVLWIAFALVHIAVAALGWILPGASMGDVYLVYEPWATRAVQGFGIVGVTEPFVYPQLALIPMIVAKALSWIGGYIVAWAVLVTALDAIAFAVLLGRGHSRGRRVAAWAWIAGMLLLGPVGMYRIDAITVPLAIMGLLWLAARPTIGSALLAIGMWVKVWPAALLAAAFIALRARLRVVGATVVVTALVIAGVIGLGGASNVFGFVGEQTGRGLQIEAPVSTVYMWRSMLDIPGSFVFYDREILTYQVTGPNVDVVIAAMTPILAVAALAVMAIGAFKAWRGARFVRLAPPLALALVLTLIVFNKVGSPQFMIWLVAPLAFWLVLDRARAWVPTLLAGIALALTQIIYPNVYNDVLRTIPYAVILLTLRNVLLVVLLVVVVAAVMRIPTRRGAGIIAVPKARERRSASAAAHDEAAPRIPIATSDAAGADPVAP